jgi:beta-galactosidase
MNKNILYNLVLIALSISCVRKDIVVVEKDFESEHKISAIDFQDKFLFGAAYYPEQWPKNRWDDDFRRMKEIGINTVRMGEFAWSSFEPSTGKFTFEWMDEAIEMAASYGISTILCTPTASVPPWLAKEFPDVLTANEKGLFQFGTRQGVNPNSINYRNACNRIVSAMAKHFGDNKNVAGWQLANEPGHPFDLYDKQSEESFRLWLQEKYETPDSINKAWHTAFWSHQYSSWDQLHLPPVNGAAGEGNPGLILDFRRFFSDSFLSFLKAQEQILRQHTGSRFIFTNWPNTWWSINIHKASGFLDFHGWDNYSGQPEVLGFRSQYYAGMNHDLLRCTNPQQIFIISEQDPQPSSVGLAENVRLRTFINLAHGAYGTLFFEWRSPLNGAEQGYVSILQIDGSDGPSVPQIKKMTSEFNRIQPELVNTKVESDIALMYCYDNQWIQGWWEGKGYDTEAMNYYTGLKIIKRNIDVVSVDHNFSSYKILAAPGLRIVGNELAEKLKLFVSNGGILVLNREAGTKNLYNSYREIRTPGLFSDMAGVDIPWVVTRNEQGSIEKISITFGDDKQFVPDSYMDLIHTTSAEIMAKFSKGNLNGKPAVTINQYNKGYVVYVGADSKDPDFYEALFVSLRERFAIKPIMDVPEAVEVVSRSSETMDYVFLLNLENKINQVKLPERAFNFISNQEEEGLLSLKPLDVAVLKIPKVK